MSQGSDRSPGDHSLSFQHGPSRPIRVRRFEPISHERGKSTRHHAGLGAQLGSPCTADGSRGGGGVVCLQVDVAQYIANHIPFLKRGFSLETLLHLVFSLASCAAGSTWNNATSESRMWQWPSTRGTAVFAERHVIKTTSFAALTLQKTTSPSLVNTCTASLASSALRLVGS